MCLCKRCQGLPPIVPQACSAMKQKKKTLHATAFSAVDSAAIISAERSFLLFLHWLHQNDSNSLVDGYLSCTAPFPLQQATAGCAVMGLCMEYLDAHSYSERISFRFLISHSVQVQK